jgi:hypothetical protein
VSIRLVNVLLRVSASNDWLQTRLRASVPRIVAEDYLLLVLSDSDSFGKWCAGIDIGNGSESMHGDH